MSSEAGTKVAPHRASAYAWYALGVLVLVYVVNFIDRQILAILAEDVKRDLDLDDAEVGFLYGTAFAVFYALFGIPLGRLADNWHRGRLVAIGLAFWSSMTALSGFATSFALLATARIGVGIGEATAAPASYSMISDYFPAKRRATALSIYASGLYIGSGLSLPIGGFVLSRWNAAFPDPALAPLGLAGWQAGFLAVGLPGLLIALWVLSLKEPPRGAGEGIIQPTVRPGAWRGFGQELVAILPPLTLYSASRYPGELRLNLIGLASVMLVTTALVWALGDLAQWTAYGLGVYAVFSWVRTLKYRDPATFRLIWGTPAVLTLAIAFGSLGFITYAVGFWTPPYALRTFYDGPGGASRYFSGITAAEEVAIIIGWSSAISAAVGVILGGVIADWWRQRHPGGRLFVNMGALLLSMPLVAFMFSTESPSLFFLINPIAVLLISAWSGAAVATLQDVVLPRMRATAGATFVLGITMIGLALGPYTAGKVATITGDLRIGIFALYVVAPFTLFALWRASRALETVEATIVERARAAGENI
jgi:MFS family permease